MEIRVLRTFVVVARERSITKAAQVLHVTQPALSRQLKNLETELGEQLFVRGHREISLTNAGKYLFEQALLILQIADKTTTNIHQGEAVSGMIDIGVTESPSMFMVDRVIEKLLRHNPNVQVHLSTATSSDVTRGVREGVLDFGVVIAPSSSEDLKQMWLKQHDAWGVLLPENHPLAKHEVVTPSDLRDEALIMPQVDLIDSRFAEWFGNTDFQQNVRVTYNLALNAAFLARFGAGLALVRAYTINVDNLPLVFRPLSPTLESSLMVIWQPDREFSPAARAFLRILQGSADEIADLADQGQQDLFGPTN